MKLDLFQDESKRILIIEKNKKKQGDGDAEDDPENEKYVHNRVCDKN